MREIHQSFNELWCKKCGCQPQKPTHKGYLIPGAIREEDNVVRDTDGDGLSDYYEKLINTGELKLGNGMCLWDFPGATQLSWADPNNQDSDGDGIPDGEEIEIRIHPDTGKPYIYVYSNPCLYDSDGDGLDDMIDRRPLNFDVRRTNITSDTIEFNTGRVWHRIESAKTYYYFWQRYTDDWAIIADRLTTAKPMKDAADANQVQNFTLSELKYIAFANFDGLQIYLSYVDNKSMLEDLFKTLYGRESRYYQFSLPYYLQEVPKGTPIGYTSHIYSEAEMNFTFYPYIMTEYKVDLAEIIFTAGTLSIPYALEFVSLGTGAAVEVADTAIKSAIALQWYIENFGVVEGFKLWYYLGTAGIPDEVLGIVSTYGDDLAAGIPQVIETELPSIKTLDNAVVDIRKFSGYIFRGDGTGGKEAVYNGLGYNIQHSEMLSDIYLEQAVEKYANNQYTLGSLIHYGQTINIEIELQGIDSFLGKTSCINSGWLINPDGTIRLTTPFAGFTR